MILNRKSKKEIDINSKEHDRVYTRERPKQKYKRAIMFIGSYVFAMMFIPIFFDGSTGHATTPTRQIFGIGNNINARVESILFNEDDRIMEIFFSFSPTAIQHSLANIDFGFDVLTINDMQNHGMRVSHIPLINNHHAVILEDVPEGFEVIRVDVLTGFIHEELATSNQWGGSNINSIHIVENQVDVDNSLTVTTPNALNVRSLSFEKVSIEENTYDLREFIRQLYLSDDLIQREISEIERTINFLIAEDQSTYNARLNTLRNELESNERNRLNHLEQIYLNNQRIEAIVVMQQYLFN